MAEPRIIKVFLASSKELIEDRQAFELSVSRKNSELIRKGVYIEVVLWENFLDAMARTRLQDTYNDAIRQCDLFVLLFWTKVGKYSEEEFTTALKEFRTHGKPLLFTYYKDAPPPDGILDSSLERFQARLKELGHYQTTYTQTEGLLRHFDGQLDKLIAAGVIEFQPEPADWPMPELGSQFRASFQGSGAQAIGPNATAVGARGILISGNNNGIANTGKLYQTDGGAVIEEHAKVVIKNGDFIGRDKITTTTTIHQGLASDELEGLFATLLSSLSQQAPSGQQAVVVDRIQALKQEARKGKQADDGVLAGIVHGLAELVPRGVGALVSMFASPILQGIAGPVTRMVLEKLKGG